MLKNSEGEDETQKGEPTTKAFLKDKIVVVSDPKSVEELQSRGYGIRENSELKLAAYEVLYLLEKRLIRVLDEETTESLSFEKLLQHFRLVDENTWVKYLIYRDLRGRGYVAREGFGLGVDFRLYERGKYGKEAAKYIVLGILEGKPLSVEELAKVLKYVQNVKKKLILAVINRRGEVVYYSLSKFTLSEV